MLYYLMYVILSLTTITYLTILHAILSHVVTKTSNFNELQIKKSNFYFHSHVIVNFYQSFSIDFSKRKRLLGSFGPHVRVLVSIVRLTLPGDLVGELHSPATAVGGTKTKQWGNSMIETMIMVLNKPT